MLDHITVRECASLGQLAEILLFYNRVTIYVSEGLLRALSRDVGPARLVSFLEDHKDRVEFRYIDWSVMVVGTSGDDHNLHFVVGDESTLAVDEPYLDYLRRIGNLDTSSGFIRSPELAHRLLGLIGTDGLHNDLFQSFFSPELVNVKLPGFVESCVGLSYADLEELPSGLTFELEQDLGGFTIRYGARQQIDQRRRFQIDDIIVTYIRTSLELSIWGERSSELLLNELESDAVRFAIGGVLQRRMGSVKAIESFQQAVFAHSRAISQAIESGERTFRDFIGLYERSYRFRAWLNGLPFDGDILRGYIQAVTADHWAEKLPSKTARWMLFTGAGLAIDVLGAGGVGTLSGLMLSAFDAFVLDKLLHGWRPNQFVQDHAARFLQPGARFHG